MVRMCTVNVNSLISKMHYLSSLASQESLHVISITETWLTKDCPSSFVELPDYNFYRGDVHGDVKKHGTGLYVHKKFKGVQLEIDLPNLAAVHIAELNLHVMSVYT